MPMQNHSRAHCFLSFIQHYLPNQSLASFSKPIIGVFFLFKSLLFISSIAILEVKLLASATASPEFPSPSLLTPATGLASSSLRDSRISAVSFSRCLDKALHTSITASVRPPLTAKYNQIQRLTRPLVLVVKLKNSVLKRVCGSVRLFPCGIQLKGTHSDKRGG